MVTGAASGIGMGYAVALVEKGYFVLITDIDEAGAQRVATELNATGPGKADALGLDVGDGAAAHGVNVTVVLPIAVNTNIVRHITADMGGSGNCPPSASGKTNRSRRSMTCGFD
ncbi:SDR family NAD(P)-dependent oxidoreductase [Nocardia sp. NPDC051030]|uniref:SDR family NAD(P)-dependent oxidoreductase n=1 Tax=Nocardia sp. NPDC051030 TaxID=3155162 RepID=UPI0034435B6D